MKIVVIGNVATGKTSLCVRWAHGTFTDNYKATVGVDFVVKGNLQLWDVAGQERFGAVTASFYRASHGALVVVDWTQEDAIEQAQKWIDDYQRKYTADVPILILANKADLPGRICMEDLDALCKRNAAIIGWIPTSAKTGMGVADAVDQLITRVSMQEEREANDETVQLQEKQDENGKNCCN